MTSKQAPAPSSQIGRLQKAAKRATDEGDLSQAEKRVADTARYEALAREHGAALSEEGFNAALRKIASPEKKADAGRK